MKFILHPGKIKSVVDGDIHYISYNGLINLYGLNPKDCINFGHNKGDIFEDHIHLYPLRDGNYREFLRLSLLYNRQEK